MSLILGSKSMPDVSNCDCCCERRRIVVLKSGLSAPSSECVHTQPEMAELDFYTSILFTVFQSKFPREARTADAPRPDSYSTDRLFLRTGLRPFAAWRAMMRLYPKLAVNFSRVPYSFRKKVAKDLDLRICGQNRDKFRDWGRVSPPLCTLSIKSCTDSGWESQAGYLPTTARSGSKPQDGAISPVRL